MADLFKVTNPLDLIPLLFKASGLKVQSLIFDKGRFKTAAQAIAWAKSHGYKVPKVDETEDKWRVRQEDPGGFKKGATKAGGDFITHDLTDGVSATMGKKKSQKNRETEDQGAAIPGSAAVKPLATEKQVGGGILGVDPHPVGTAVSERERRFKVPEEHRRQIQLIANGAIQIHQGYLSREPLLRVRKSQVVSPFVSNSPTYTLTRKDGHGIQRMELEVEIPPEIYEALWPLCRSIISKLRYLVEMGDRVWTVDDMPEGPMIAEIELDEDGEDDDIPAQSRPYWLGEEITEGYHYPGAAVDGTNPLAPQVEPSHPAGQPKLNPEATSEETNPLAKPLPPIGKPQGQG
jgi:CYTH domain-containing protein